MLTNAQLLQGCFQSGNTDILYHIGETIDVVNLADWTVNTLGDTPDQFGNIGTCSIMADPNDDSNLRFCTISRAMSRYL